MIDAILALTLLLVGLGVLGYWLLIDFQCRMWSRGFQDGYKLRQHHDALIAAEAQALGKAEGRIEMLREIVEHDAAHVLQFTSTTIGERIH